MGILTADGTYWQALRQAWQAMFHPDRCRFAECRFYTVLLLPTGKCCGWYVHRKLCGSHHYHNTITACTYMYSSKINSSYVSATAKSSRLTVNVALCDRGMSCPDQSPEVAACSLRQYTNFINKSSQRLVEALEPACKARKPVEMWRLVSDLIGIAKPCSRSVQFP